MQLSGFDRFAWAATFYGHILLLFVLFLRGRAKSFPLFTAWIVESVLRTSILYVVFSHFSEHAYFDWYVTFAMLDEVLQLLVLYEIAVHVFCPMGVWAADIRKPFLGLLSASIVIALSLTWLSAPMARRASQTFILRENFFSSALMSELFVGMVVLSATVGLPWKTHVARIAQGLGAYSLVCVGRDIVINSVRLSQNGQIYSELSHFRILTYLVCEGFWIVMLWQSAPAPRELPESLRTQIYTLQKRVEYDLIRIRDWRRN